VKGERRASCERSLAGQCATWLAIDRGGQEARPTAGEKTLGARAAAAAIAVLAPERNEELTLDV
jgi:hypothetical protein